MPYDAFDPIDSRPPEGDRLHMPPFRLPALIYPALAFLAISTAPGASASELKSPELVFSPVEGADLVVVRLDVLCGHGDETRRNAGQSAASSAWLRRGPSNRFSPGEFESYAHRQGLKLESELSWRSASLSLTGPEPLAELAGALIRDRMLTQGASGDVVEIVRGALWQGAETSMRGIVGPMGNALNTTVSALEGGRSAFASRVAASRLDGKAFRRLARSCLRERRARVLVTGSPSALSKAKRGFGLDATSRENNVKGGQHRSLSKARRMNHRPHLEVEQATDQHERVAVAWTLRGLASQHRLSLHKQDALLLALRAWLDHPGSALAQNLVDTLGALHELSVRLIEYDAPVLVLSGDVAGGHAPDVKREVLFGMEDALKHSGAGLRKGRLLAAQDLRRRFEDVQARSTLWSELFNSGRAHSHAAALAWLEGVLTLLDAPSMAWAPAYLKGAFTPERRVILEAKPLATPGLDPLRRGSPAMDTYLRVLVDLQCPGPRFPTSVQTLLGTKYGMTPRQYADRTRAIARDRRLMRELAEDADYRCQELKRLRGIMRAERVVKLHEAVVCGPGVAPDHPEGKAELKKVFRRFKVDPSWYRPLLQMAQEAPHVSAKLKAIAQRCQGEEGGP